MLAVISSDLLMCWKDIKETFCTLQVACMEELGHRQQQYWKVLVWPMGEELVSELNLGLFHLKVVPNSQM